MPAEQKPDKYASQKEFLSSIPQGETRFIEGIDPEQFNKLAYAYRAAAKEMGVRASVMIAGQRVLVSWFPREETSSQSSSGNSSGGTNDRSNVIEPTIPETPPPPTDTNPKPLGTILFGESESESVTSKREPHGLTGIVGRDGILTAEQQNRLDEIQMAAVEATTIYQRYKEPEEPSPLVHMATGIGKGKIIYEEISQQLSEDPSKPVLVIIGTRDHLREQMEKAIGRYQQSDRENIVKVEAQLRSTLIDELADDENDQETEEDRTEAAAVETKLIEEDAFKGFTFGKYGTQGVNIQLSTIQTLQAAVKRGDFDPTQYGMVIVDEVHNLGTRQRKAVVTACQQQGIPVVGLTATAYRNSGSMRTPEQYGFTTVITYPLPEAQGEHLLPTLYGLPFQTAEILGDTPIPRKENGRIDYDALEIILKDHPELRSYIVDKLVPIITFNGSRYKTIIPVNYVWEAQEYAELLKASGISVGLLINQSAARELHTEKIPTLDTLRRYALSQDDPESIQVLISPNLAGEGFDAPWTEILCWGSPTDSDLRYTQYVGRLARRHPGKAWGLVIDPLYHLDQFTWSMNMAQWMKGDVKQLENGLLYLGPLHEVGGIEPLMEISKSGDTKTLEELEKEDNIPEAPEGWFIITSTKEVDNLVTELDRSYEWIVYRMPIVLTMLQNEDSVKGIDPEKREPVSGKYRSKSTGRVSIHYSPTVREALKEISEKEKRGNDWFVMGSLTQPNTVTFILGRSRKWIYKYLEEAISNVREEIAKNIEKDQPLPELVRESTKRGGRKGEPLKEYSFLVVDELKRISEREREQNKRQAVSEADFKITVPSFLHQFKGGFNPGERLRTIADRVVQRLRESYPDKFSIKKSFNTSIEVFNDKNLLIEEMVKAGATLRSNKD